MAPALSARWSSAIRRLNQNGCNPSSSPHPTDRDTGDQAAGSLAGGRLDPPPGRPLRPREFPDDLAANKFLAAGGGPNRFLVAPTSDFSDYRLVDPRKFTRPATFDSWAGLKSFAPA